MVGRKYKVSLNTFFSSSLISLIADGPHHYIILPVVTKDLPISPRFTPYNFLLRCKFSTLTPRQPMVEVYLLTFPRFPLRKKEHKSYFGKNRTDDFRTSRCAGYLLDHSGDIIVEHLLTAGVKTFTLLTLEPSLSTPFLALVGVHPHKSLFVLVTNLTRVVERACFPPNILSVCWGIFPTMNIAARA